MKRLLVVLALVAAACGSQATDKAVETITTAAETPSSVADEPSDGTPAPQSTTTTVAEPTTTTTVAETTTTTPPLAGREAAAGSLARIQYAMTQTSDTLSARMEGMISVIGAAEFEGDFVMSFAAAHDNATGNSSFSIDLSSLGDLIQAQAEVESDDPEDAIGAAFAEIFLAMFTQFEVRHIGDTVYMNNPFFTSMAGEDTTWIASPVDPEDDATGSFLQGAPTTPDELFGPFLDAGGVVEELGTETLRGVETTHYRVIFDREAMLAAADPSERAELEEELALYEDEIDAQVWVDDQYVYKFLIDIDGSELDVPEEESFDRMTMVFEIWDYGESITIEPPPADEVTFVEDGISLGG